MNKKLFKGLGLLFAFYAISFTGNSQLTAAISSCNQGYTPSGLYKIRYTVVLENPSNTDSIGGIQLFDPLETLTAFDANCVTLIDGKSITTVNRVGFIFPQEYDGSDWDPGFVAANIGNPGDTGLFNPLSVSGDTLYPRQRIIVNYCVYVDPACAGGVGVGAGST